MKKKEKHQSFAMEICRKYKSKAKAWCIVAIIELVLLVSVLSGVLFTNAETFLKVLKTLNG
jgi:hypothetical protein